MYQRSQTACLDIPHKGVPLILISTLALTLSLLPSEAIVFWLC